MSSSWETSKRRTSTTSSNPILTVMLFSSRIRTDASSAVVATPQALHPTPRERDEANRPSTPYDRELDAMIDKVITHGVERAFANLGIANGHAARDICDLRSFMEAIRVARPAFVQTLIRVFTTGLILFLMVGIAIKPKLFKGD